MKVYVIVNEYQFDCGAEETKVIGVFKDLEKAKKCYKKMVKVIKDDWLCSVSLYDETNTDIEENETNFSISEKGEYCYNHETLYLIAQKLL